MGRAVPGLGLGWASDDARSRGRAARTARAVRCSRTARARAARAGAHVGAYRDPAAAAAVRRARSSARARAAPSRTLADRCRSRGHAAHADRAARSYRIAHARAARSSPTGRDRAAATARAGASGARAAAGRRDHALPIPRGSATPSRRAAGRETGRADALHPARRPPVSTRNSARTHGRAHHGEDHVSHSSEDQDQGDELQEGRAAGFRSLGSPKDLAADRGSSQSPNPNEHGDRSSCGDVTFFRYDVILF